MSVILFPTHTDYCKECMYHSSGGTCNSDEYNKHTYEVNCVWKYCKFKKTIKRDHEENI